MLALHIFKSTLSMSQMVSLYYALPSEKDSDCQKFNLSVQLIPGNMSLTDVIITAWLIGLGLFWDGKSVVKTMISKH